MNLRPLAQSAFPLPTRRRLCRKRGQGYEPLLSVVSEADSSGTDASTPATSAALSSPSRSASRGLSAPSEDLRQTAEALRQQPAQPSRVSPLQSPEKATQVSCWCYSSSHRASLVCCMVQARARSACEWLAPHVQGKPVMWSPFGTVDAQQRDSPRDSTPPSTPPGSDPRTPRAERFSADSEGAASSLDGSEEPGALHLAMLRVLRGMLAGSPVSSGLQAAAHIAANKLLAFMCPVTACLSLDNTAAWPEAGCLLQTVSRRPLEHAACRTWPGCR